MRRGEVWQVSSPPPPSTASTPTQLQAARSPHYVLLLSWDAGQSTRDRVTVAPISTEIRDLDAEVLLDRSDGMPQRCAINLDIMATILNSRIIPGSRQTALTFFKMREVERAIHLALNISLPCTITHQRF